MRTTTLACCSLDLVHLSHIHFVSLPLIPKTVTASSAYDDIEWINKLVDYVKRIAETKPHIKLIGRSVSISLLHIFTVQQQASVLVTKSSRELSVANVFSMVVNGR